MGLSKPIIITSSSVDVSNLATKSDLDTLANTVSSSVGAVKSVQRGLCYSTSRYNKITISSVNISKSVAFCPVAGDGTRAPGSDFTYNSSNESMSGACRLKDATTLELHKQTTNSEYCVPWVVIEFK